MEDEKQITPLNENVKNEEQATTSQTTVNEFDLVEKFELETVLQDIASLFQDLCKANQILNSKITNSDKCIRDIDGSLRGLASYIDENSKRTRRLEEGYDFQILKNFVRQIIREINGLKIAIDKTEDKDKKSTMQDTIDALVELLDRNSIVQITPEIGSCYAGQEKFAECTSQKFFTEDDELNGRVASVIREGYQYEFNDGSIRVLEPAKVILFSTNREQCSDPTDFSKKLIRNIKKKIEACTKAQRKSLWEEESCSEKTFEKLLNNNSAYFVIIAGLCALSIILSVIVFQQHKTIIEFTSKASGVPLITKEKVVLVTPKVSVPLQVNSAPATDKQSVKQTHAVNKTQKKVQDKKQATK